MSKQPYTEDLVGITFNRFLVTRFVGRVPRYFDNRNNQNVPVWECRCICGKLVELIENRFKYGAAKSCGCLNSEVAARRFRTHGDSKTRLYTTWKNMKARCYLKTSTHYETYGGRGIKLCEQWKKDFLHFKEWALGSGYSEDLTIDRINNDGDYEPVNCRWVTLSENGTFMNQHHLRNGTGGHSKESRDKVKNSNRKNNGIGVSLTKGEENISFGSIGEAADHLSKLLGRKRVNVYSHLKQLNKGKVLQLGGWKIANT